MSAPDIICQHPANEPCIPTTADHGRTIAWDRAETDACQANTPGCAIDHNTDHGDCEGW